MLSAWVRNTFKKQMHTLIYIPNLINFLFSFDLNLFLDNAILTQSRFILMESIMMCFGLGAILAVLKFKKVSSQPFTGTWFFWLCTSTLLATAAFRYSTQCSFYRFIWWDNDRQIFPTKITLSVITFQG